MFFGRVCGSTLTLAFSLRNSFDDKPIRNENFNFYINGVLASLIKKQDGFYIITDIADECFTLKITSVNYYDKVVSINMNELSDLENAIEIFLVPNYKYVKRPSSYYLSGVADIGTEVIATKLSNRSNIRFENFDKESMQLKVRNPIKERLVGRYMAVINNGKDNFSPVFMRYKVSDDIYKIENSVDLDFKLSSPLQKAFITFANNEGKYRLYVSDDCLDGETYIISYIKNNQRIFEKANVNLFKDDS